VAGQDRVEVLGPLVRELRHRLEDLRVGDDQLVERLAREAEDEVT